MDMTEPLDILDSESFTFILDKATLDCVTCSDQYGKKTQQYLENLHRILAPGGTYLCVSHGRPETRLPQISSSNFKWQVETLKVNKKDDGGVGLVDQEQFYYVYVMTKKY
jgi:ubiquinone/menaquinone biosynthesis C-methylase UbiE